MREPVITLDALEDPQTLTPGALVVSTRQPPFRLGGRVVQHEGSRLWIADADHIVHVELQSGAAESGREIRVGDLVVLRIVRSFDNQAAEPSRHFAADRLNRVGRDVRAFNKNVHQGGETARLSRSATYLRKRAGLLSCLRTFFESRGFLEVETPTVVPSPGLDVHLDAVELQLRGRYLTTSPELQMKRLLVGGLPKIFQLSRCHRAGEVGPRHNPEFTMLEWYRAYATMEDVVADTEALFIELLTHANGQPTVVNHANSAATELVRSDEVGRTETQLVRSDEVGRTETQLVPPFERLPILTAFARHARVTEEQALRWALSGSPTDEEHYFRVLVDEVEPALALGPPVFLTRYPITQASLAKPCDDDPRLAQRFELFACGIELCNGFGELCDPVVQRARYAEDQHQRSVMAKPVYPVDARFLEALDEGMPPSAGNALGIDRMIAMCLGCARIEDVMTFPEGWL